MQEFPTTTRASCMHLEVWILPRCFSLQEATQCLTREHASCNFAPTIADDSVLHEHPSLNLTHPSCGKCNRQGTKMQFEQGAKCGRSNWSGERFQTRTWIVSIASLLAVVVARMAHPCDCTSLSCILLRLLPRERALQATCRFAIRTTWLRSSMHAHRTTSCLVHGDVRPSAIAVVRASVAWP